MLRNKKIHGSKFKRLLAPVWCLFYFYFFYFCPHLIFLQYLSGYTVQPLKILNGMIKSLNLDDYFALKCNWKRTGANYKDIEGQKWEVWKTKIELIAPNAWGLKFWVLLSFMSNVGPTLTEKWLEKWVKNRDQLVLFKIVRHNVTNTTWP